MLTRFVLGRSRSGARAFVALAAVAVGIALVLSASAGAHSGSQTTRVNRTQAVIAKHPAGDRR